MPKTRRQANTILESVLNAQVPIITEWQSYTPTVVGLGTGTATVGVSWRRVGSDIEIKGQLTMTSSGSGTAQVQIGLPSGLSFATINGDTMGVGWEYGPFATLYLRASGTFMFFARQSDGNNFQGQYLGNGDIISFEGSYPISGWTSTQTLRQQLGL